MLASIALAIQWLRRWHPSAAGLDEMFHMEQLGKTIQFALNTCKMKPIKKVNKKKEKVDKTIDVSLPNLYPQLNSQPFIRPNYPVVGPTC